MFYYTNNISVYQLKLTAYDSLSIATSHTLIATPANPTFQIEEGLDGKLYVAIGGSNVLDVINAPNSTFCDYTSNAITTNGLVLLGLPARVPERNFSSPPITMLPDSCWQSTTSFSINTDLSINQVSWNFGDPNSGGSNTSTMSVPSHSFSNVGTYTVSALVEFQCYTDTLALTLSVVDCPQDPPPPIQTAGGISFILQQITKTIGMEKIRLVRSLRMGFIPINSQRKQGKLVMALCI